MSAKHQSQISQVHGDWTLKTLRAATEPRSPHGAMLQCCNARIPQSRHRFWADSSKTRPRRAAQTRLMNGHGCLGGHRRGINEAKYDAFITEIWVSVLNRHRSCDIGGGGGVVSVVGKYPPPPPYAPLSAVNCISSTGLTVLYVVASGSTGKKWGSILFPCSFRSARMRSPPPGNKTLHRRPHLFPPGFPSVRIVIAWH